MPTSTLGQLQGRILEIALLSLLKASGYHTLRQPNRNDPTVVLGRNGLEVRGRSGFHQIDGIADFFLSPPLSHPLRLLVVGQYHQSNKEKVGI